MKAMEKFKTPLTIYVLIIIIGLLAFYFTSTDNKDNLWNWFGAFDTSSAVAVAILAIFVYYEYIKQDETIKIYFLEDDKKIDTGLSLLRKEFSRSEILGLLGMIKKDPENRFKLSYFQNPYILKDIQNIQKGKGKEFIIKVKKDELKYFDIKA